MVYEWHKYVTDFVTKMVRATTERLCGNIQQSLRSELQAPGGLRQAREPSYDVPE